MLSIHVFIGIDKTLSRIRNICKYAYRRNKKRDTTHVGHLIVTEQKGDYMIKEYNNISLTWGIPGIALQIAGNVIGQPLILVLGTVLLMIGLAYYAKAKGRSPAWCLMGFLSIIGLIVLACLKDLEKESLW